MADNNSELPEGTDKVVAGASSTTGPGTGTGQASGTGLGGTGAESNDEGEVLIATETTVATIAPADTSETSAPSSGRSGGSVIEKLRSGGGKLSGQAADKARGFLGQGIGRSAEALANVGKMVGDTAEGIDERLGEEYGDYARRAASAIENTANSIAAKDPDELIDDTRNFVRKSPAIALAGAAVAGFVLARLVKSGLEAAMDNDEEDDDDGNRGGGRSRRSSEA